MLSATPDSPIANRDTSVYNGTAPVEFSSGGRVVPVIRARNRHLTHAIHMAVICSSSNPSMAVFSSTARAEGKTSRTALRALKRHTKTPCTGGFSPTREHAGHSGQGDSGNDFEPA